MVNGTQRKPGLGRKTKDRTNQLAKLPLFDTYAPARAPARPGAEVRLLTRLIVTRAARLERREPWRGRLQIGGASVTCAIGRAGIRHRKREGDGATPAGRFACLQGFFKADCTPRPSARLPLRPIKRDMGWCDDPQAASYNRAIRLPARIGHETLWRDDGLYDLVIVIDYNFSRRAKYRGSAIFLHCARPGFAPTEGCIALAPDVWRRLLPRLSRRAILFVR